MKINKINILDQILSLIRRMKDSELICFNDHSILNSVSSYDTC